MNRDKLFYHPPEVVLLHFTSTRSLLDSLSKPSDIESAFDGLDDLGEWTSE